MAMMMPQPADENPPPDISHLLAEIDRLRVEVQVQKGTDYARIGELRSQQALALSILRHRHWCAGCRKHVAQAEMALMGATLEELAD